LLVYQRQFLGCSSKLQTQTPDQRLDVGPCVSRRNTRFHHLRPPLEEMQTSTMDGYHVTKKGTKCCYTLLNKRKQHMSYGWENREVYR
jgi:hypothetical protein